VASSWSEDQRVPESTERALVIIPTYNERENLPKIIDVALAQDSRINILVVDYGSPDGTGELADELARQNPRINVLHRPRKMGLGTAYLTGFKWALARDFEYMLEMDADFSHDPKHLTEFLAAAETADVVVGSRYLQGRVTVVNWPMTRLMLSYTANVYARIATGLFLWDLTAGFKCFRRKVLAAIDLDAVRSNGYGFQIEMNVRAWRKGFVIREIPIVFTDRHEGTSKMSGAIVREAIWMVWRLRWWSLTGKI
jgi:dolichol-phosphate mannosyltransferase